MSRAVRGGVLPGQAGCDHLQARHEVAGHQGGELRCRGDTHGNSSWVAWFFVDRVEPPVAHLPRSWDGYQNDHGLVSAVPTDPSLPSWNMVSKKDWRQRALRAEAHLEDTVEERERLSEKVAEQKEALDPAASLLFDLLCRIRFDDREIPFLEMLVAGHARGVALRDDVFDPGASHRHHTDRKASDLHGRFWLEANGYSAIVDLIDETTTAEDDN
jgi:hypothetical protein